MPKYTVQDDVTGVTLELDGDSPPTEQELTELFSQYAQKKPAQAAQPKSAQPDLSAMSARIESEKQGPMQRLGRKVGLTSGDLVQGVLSPFAMAGDLAAYPINAVSRLSGGKDVFPPQQQALDAVLSQVGLPTAETSGEQLQSAITRGVSGAVGGVGLGAQLAKSANAITSGIGNILRTAPASQLVAGGAAGGSAELARQQGVGEAGQMAAGLVGGLGAGVAAQKVLPKSWSATQPKGMPKGATMSRSEIADAAKSKFGITTPVFDDPTIASADKTAQYKKAISILDAEGIALSKGQRSGINSMRMTETTLADLPVIGGPLQKLAEKTRIDYQKALLKKAGNESGDTMITRESLENTANALSKRYAAALKDKAVSISDDEFLNELAGIEAKHSDIVDAGTATKIKQIVDAFLTKATKEPTYTGEKYQSQRSLFASRSDGPGPIPKLYADLKYALDNAFHRAAGDKGNLDAQWSRYKQLEAIERRSGGAAMSEGFISPVQVAREAKKIKGDNEWKDFTRAAATVLPDRVGNSGTAQRSVITKAATGGFVGGAAPMAFIEPVSGLMTLGTLGASRGAASYLAKQPQQSQRPALNSLLYPVLSSQ